MSTCRCGHARHIHQHYRPGTDCAHCYCHRYIARRWWNLLRGRR